MSSKEFNDRKKLWIVLGLVVLVGLAGGMPVTNGKSAGRVASVRRVMLSKMSNNKVAKEYTPPACADGEYLASQACHPCPKGYSCKSNVKTVCPKGTFQPQTGQASCKPADCGNFVPAPGADAQQQCRPGTYSKAGAFECIPTPVGTYTGAGACDPIQCPKGEYQDCDGQKECRKVPCGHFTDQPGQTAIQKCPVGTYQPLEGQSSCLPVGKGEYAGEGYCKKRSCIPGQFQSQTNQGTCTDAQCGHFVPTSGLDNETPCGTGEWQPDAGQSMCLPIPNGYISIKNKCDIECCPAGTFRHTDFTCKPAPCGSYVKDPCMSAPTPCAPGYYTTGPGATGCIPAPLGSIPNADGCGTKKCPAGQYQDQTAQTQCKDAPCGTKAPNTGMDKPIKCPGGTFQDQTNAITCKPCPMGTAHNIEGKCICPECTPGNYQGQTGQTSCIDAPCGKYVPSPRATAPIDCPPGQYQPDVGQNMCLKAPKGSYAVGGTCQPETCVPGTFTDAVEQTKCKDSPCGYYVAGAGADVATACNPGQYQPLVGQTQCLDTPTGSYTDMPAKCEETLCPKGQYQPLTGQQMCKDADCGNYVDIVGSANQNKCGAGRYQPDKGQTTCLQADVGNFVGSEGQCGQTPCPEGTYTDCKGQSKCSTAPCGYYVTGTGQTTSHLCAAGTYQDTPGQANCKPVLAGSFAGVGFCAPEPCDPGTFQNQDGQGSCKLANCGNFVESEGRKSETQCPSSYFQPKTGQVGCLPTTHQLAPLPGTCQEGSVSSGIFYPGPSGMTWADAKNYCSNNGDRLASILSATENAQVLSVCNAADKRCWIGGSDAAKEGEWKWLDGTLFAGGYTNWAAGEPNNVGTGGEQCLETLTDGKWNDLSCAASKPFVCERRVAASPVWVLVSRQDIKNGYFAKSVATSGQFGTLAGTGNYLNLPDISKYNVDGGDYEFKMTWPGSIYDKAQIWKQTSNPFLKKSAGVVGYQAVSVPYTSQGWGGLEWNGAVSSVLDGTVNHGNWYYAVASFAVWGSGIPGPDHKPTATVPAGVPVAMLYVKKPVGSYCSRVTGYDMPHNDIGSSFAVANVQECQQKCLSNANCVCYAADYPAGTTCWLKSQCPTPMGAQSNRQSGFCFK